MISLRYYLRFTDETWTEVGALVQSSNTTPLNVNLCSTSWYATINTASFTIRYTGTDEYQPLVVKIVTAQRSKADIECKITDDDGVVLFYGIVDYNKLELTSAKIPQSLTINANDSMKRLDKVIGKNRIFKVGDTVGSVVNWMLQDAGLQAVEEWEDNADRLTLESPVVFTEDGKEKYLDEANKILQEYGGYFLVSNPATQRLHVRKIRKASNPEDVKDVHYLVSSKLTSSSSYFTNDGVVVRYKNVNTSEKELVYMASTTLRDGVLYDPNPEYDTNGSRIPSDLDGTVSIPLGDVVPVGGYFPLDGDITKTTQEYDSSLFDYKLQQRQTRKANEQLGIYYVDPATVTIRILSTDKDGHKLEDWYENTALHSAEGRFDYPAGGEFHPRKAWQLFHNKSGQCVNVQSFIIEGKAVYSDRESRLVMPSNCRDPYDYTATYISSSAKAEALASLLTDMKKYGSDTSSWTAPWDAYDLGDEVNVEHPSAAKVRAIIVKKTLKVIGSQLWAEYVAVHDEQWEAAREYTFSKADTSTPVYDPYVQAVAEGFVGTREDFKVRDKTIVEYAIIPDGEDVETFDWDSAEPDMTKVEPGQYVWMRTSIDSGVTWKYVRMMGAGPKVFSLRATSDTYRINRRANEDSKNTDIRVTVLVSGYAGTPDLYCAEAPGYLSENGVLSIPLTTPHQRLTLIATLDGEEQTLVLTGIDVTEYGVYHGARSVESMADVIRIEGDVWYNTDDGKVMVYAADEWTEASDLADKTLMTEAYSKAQRDVLSKELDRVPKSEKTVAYYGYFDHVVAANVNAEFLNAINIENNYSEGVDGYPTSGYKIDGPNGVIKSKDSYFTDANLSHAVIDKDSEFKGTLRVAELDDPNAAVLETIRSEASGSEEIVATLDDEDFYSGAELVAAGEVGDYRVVDSEVEDNLGNAYHVKALYKGDGATHTRATVSLYDGNEWTNENPFPVNVSGTAVGKGGTFKAPVKYFSPLRVFTNGVPSGNDTANISSFGASAESFYMMPFASSGYSVTEREGTYLIDRFPYAIGYMNGRKLVAFGYIRHTRPLVIPMYYNVVSYSMNVRTATTAPSTPKFIIPLDGTYKFTFDYWDGLVNTTNIKYFTYDEDDNTVEWGTVDNVSVNSSTGIATFQMTFSTRAKIGFLFYAKNGSTSIPLDVSCTATLNVTEPEYLTDGYVQIIPESGYYALFDDSEGFEPIDSSVLYASVVDDGSANQLGVTAYNLNGMGSFYAMSVPKSTKFTVTDAITPNGLALLGEDGDVLHTVNPSRFYSGLTDLDGNIPSTVWHRLGEVTVDGVVPTEDKVYDVLAESTLAFDSTLGSVSSGAENVLRLAYTLETHTLEITTGVGTYVFTPSVMFTSATIRALSKAGLLGIRTANIEAVGDNNTIGRIKPFDSIYAKTFHGEIAGVDKTNVPVGSIIPFLGSDIPSGWLLCNGGTVSKTTYPDLFAVIGYKYGGTEGDDLFGLPNLNERFLEGSETAGTYKEAGLPNISGTAKMNSPASSVGTSASTSAIKSVISQTSNKYSYGSGSYYGGDVVLDASIGGTHAVYGKSSTVQPKAITVRYIIKYTTGSAPAPSSTTIDEQVAINVAGIATINDYHWVLNKVYPVGSVYVSWQNESPASFLGGDWTPLSDGYWLRASTSGGGGTVSAGLPNITGSFVTAIAKNRLIASKAFTGASYSSSDNTIGNTGAAVSHAEYTFNANNGATTSGIYGASSTVQPPSYKVYMWRRTG